jgi:hypothetical protein
VRDVVDELRELLPPFCEFFHISPREFWDIEDVDRAAMLAYMERAIEARSRRG